MTPRRFFYENAGYSWDPKTQTRQQGRWQSARMLERAEQWAMENCLSFEWSIDEDMDASDFSDEQPWRLWVCSAHLGDGIPEASLSGIDFGRDGDPRNDPYRRVVEAGLALDVMINGRYDVAA